MKDGTMAELDLKAINPIIANAIGDKVPSTPEDLMAAYQKAFAEHSSQGPRLFESIRWPQARQIPSSPASPRRSFN